MELRADRINTLKLSGVSSILGIDFYGSGARVVEVKSHGGTLNRYNSTYTAANSFIVDFPENSSPSDRGRKLAEMLKSKKIRTRFCVSTIRSANSRVVTAEIPVETDDEPPGVEIETWIRENHEKLIRVPIPMKDLVFDYEIVSVSPGSIRCEVAFIRAAERDDLTEVVKAAGLHLLLLGYGTRSVEYGFLSASEKQLNGRCAFVFADSDVYACTAFPNGDDSEESTRVVRKTLRGVSLHDAAAILGREVEGVADIVVSGPNTPDADTPPSRNWKPLGLAPEYALAASLAMHGFVYASQIGRTVRSFDFRPEYVKAKSLEEQDKSLFKRGILIMGITLFLLLGAQFGFRSYLQGVSNRLDARSERIGPVYTEVRLLKRQVAALRLQLSGEDEMQQRSDVARILHEVAASTPGRVWLYKLVYSHKDSSSQSVSLWGYSRTNGDAASYLAGLQQDPDFSNVRVIRVGAPTQLELASFISGRLKSFVTFQIGLDIAR